MKTIVKVEITCGDNSYYDFVLAEGDSVKQIQDAIAECLWENPEWQSDDVCFWGNDISCQVDAVYAANDQEYAVLKKFGIL